MTLTNRHHFLNYKCVKIEREVTNRVFKKKKFLIVLFILNLRICSRVVKCFKHKRSFKKTHL
jgi:hypothetical protein